MPRECGETWRFEIEDPRAERVYLVKDCDGGLSSWIEMAADRPGHWQAVTRLSPGRYRFRYFTAEGTTFINGGDFGLSAERVEGADPGVAVELSHRIAQLA